MSTEVTKDDLLQLTSCLWQIPKDFRDDMRVPAHIYALEEMLDDVLKDRSVNQLINVSTLPGIRKAAMVMPDVHEGYGFPIGGVAATHFPDGVISPGGIGYDINCGVRLMMSSLTYDEVKDHLDALSDAVNEEIPSGVGKGGSIRLGLKQMDEVLKKGANWAVENGYGNPDDLRHIESHGMLSDADPECVSEFAKKRGADQLGTIGAGNHFVEVDRVDTIFDEATAQAFGLIKDQIVVLIHTGSRGLGHQVATDYLKLMVNAMKSYHISVPDRELACVPFNSFEGQEYFHAMSAAANFAWCNREVIADEIRRAWKKVFGESGSELKLLYDVAHNIAKIEEHEIDGQLEKVIVHRKGATRAFGPGMEELPEDFRHIGQPVLIPGSMGTSSYVLCGTQKAMESTFGSSCHGAGRRMSRRAVKKEVDAPSLKKELEAAGIHIRAGSFRGIAEEAPQAYKDVDLVVETVDQAGIARKIAQLKPLVVIKG